MGFFDNVSQVTIDEALVKSITINSEIVYEARPTEREVTIQIYDDGQNVLDGASIFIDENTPQPIERITGNEGYIDVKLSDGEHTIRVYKSVSGYEYVADTTITVSANNTFNIVTEKQSLLRTVSVTVRLDSKSGSPVRNATVKFGGVTLPEDITRTTGFDGSCTFPNIPDGLYDIKTSASGYTGSTKGVNVDEAHTNFTVCVYSK